MNITPEPVQNSSANQLPKKLGRRSFFQRDEQGQIALFVALIFQIIFVLFALVINVGLLVHHKINLQQSTDLAAYYGAMKQGEILNAIAHVNFQMKQAWKLFTWRYRIIGSFSYLSVGPTPSGVPIQIVSVNNSQTTLNFDENLALSKCTTVNNEQLRHSDLSPFCVGHNGFGDWGAAQQSGENTCSTDCNRVKDGTDTIVRIPQLTNPVSVPGASVAGSINILIQRANDMGNELCRKGTLTNLAQLANMMAAYFIDMENRNQLAQVLMSGLLVPAEQMVDLDGGLVKDGVLKTLQYNLTDANFNSLGIKYKFFNSTSTDNVASKCNSREKVFNELTFQFIELVMNVCDAPGFATTVLRASKFQSIYNLGTYELNTVFDGIATREGADISQIKQIVRNQFKLGYEKNPWCQNYFGVRATTEPNIPFLPMAKIKLHATSFAKPFGGSIGPWFYSLWPSGSDKSDSGTQVDKAMPPLRINAGFGNTLVEKLKVIPNFSNYVGDLDGTRDPIYQAIFHDFLLTRSLSNNSNDASKSREPGNPTMTPSKPQTGYPFFSNWRNVGKALTDTDYDPLAVDRSIVANSYIRDLEIAAIAPNQFDLTYYSIDPDFYHNYYKNKLDNNGPGQTLNKFKDLTSGFSNVTARPDYGYSRALFNRGSIPEDYSVRHQLAVVEQIFKYDGSSTGMDQLKVTGLKNSSSVIQKYFSFIPRFQGSLLTGWTYKDLVSQDGFTQFPNASSGTKMIFGECSAPFPSTGTPKYGTMVTDVISAGLPPAPGNCVTGGRTGYSVKIVNPASFNEAQGDIGGPGTSGASIQNPIPPDFFDFN